VAGGKPGAGAAWEPRCTGSVGVLAGESLVSVTLTRLAVTVTGQIPTREAIASRAGDGVARRGDRQPSPCSTARLPAPQSSAPRRSGW